MFCPKILRWDLEPLRREEHRNARQPVQRVAEPIGIHQKRRGAAWPRLAGHDEPNELSTHVSTTAAPLAAAETLKQLTSESEAEAEMIATCL